MRPAYGAEGIRIGQHLLTIVVDVANVMGSRPDGWWRDRAGAAVRLHGELVRLAASGRAVPLEELSPTEARPAFVMVLEGAARAAAARIGVAGPGKPADLAGLADEVEPGEVTVVQAPGSGDDAIVAVVRALAGRRVVVTADRELRRRCVAAGATIAGPGWLLGLLGP
jgi:8-oxo-dGTP diphosphatase